MRKALLSLAFLALAACGPSAPLTVEVGTGDAHFEPLADGAEVEIVCGPQGGKHLWTSVRALGADPHAARVSLSIAFADGSGPVCRQDFDAVELSIQNGWTELDGVACVVLDPERLRGRPLVLTGEITDSTGRTGSATRRLGASGPKSCAFGP